MNNERKSQLQNISQKLDNPQNSLQEVKKLYEEANIDLVAYYTTKRSEAENLPLETEIYQKTGEKLIAYGNSKLSGKKLTDNFHLFTDEELEIFK